jgi:hypothetical protein
MADDTQLLSLEAVHIEHSISTNKEHIFHFLRSITACTSKRIKSVEYLRLRRR